MADLSSKDSAGNTKLVGSDSSGVETNYAIVNSEGSLQVDMPANHFDVFGRLRVSEPESVFEASFRTSTLTDLYSYKQNASGTLTHTPAIASVILGTSTTSGSYSKLKTRVAFTYHPGKSSRVLMSGSFIESKTGSSKRMGQFDSSNGYFFELTDNILYAVLRSSSSGSVVDTKVAQSSWNIDKLDGTGASGVTLDITKQQILLIDYQWLGSGRIRYGFCMDGAYIYVHEMVHANIVALPYSSTASLPLAAECVANSSNANTTLRVTCMSLDSEGGWGPEGIIRNVNNGTTARSLGATGSTSALIAIRLQSGFLNQVIDLIEFSALANSVDDFILTVVKNPTITGGTWVDIGNCTQYNKTSTAISGGTDIYSMYIRGANTTQAIASDIMESTTFSSIGTDFDGVSDILALKATAVTASSTIFSSLTFREVV